MKGYDQLIAIIGVSTKIFSSVSITKGVDNESPYFEPLLKETAQIHSVDLVCADPAYLSRDNCDLVAGLGAVPRILPKKNTRLKKKGSKAWKDMLLNLLNDPQEWLRDYHKRSISETGFSVLKRKFTRPLSRRITFRRRIEAFTRICNYNIRRLSYLSYTGLEVPWLQVS